MSEIYTDPPQSRNEAIIKSTIDGTQYTAPPQSRMEDLLLELKEAIEQGGGGGTTNYNQLTNKPKINNVELSGNKTSADLGLMPHYDIDEEPTEESENLITSGGVWTADKNINNKLQGSKQASSTSGTIEIPDYGMTESIDMYFKPTQDLHGYDKPWAGGAGKNKFDEIYPDISAGVQYKAIYVGDGTFTMSTTTPTTPTTATNLFFLTGNVSSGASTDANGVSQYVSRTITSTNGYVTVGYRNAESIDPNNYNTQIEKGNQATAYEPYSNICPISGQNNATFSWTDSHDIENEVTIDFGQTYYGGFCQFATGAIYPDWDYIASYNGETLSGEWVSDRDEYVAGTTPTIGAEVAYKTTPSYVRVTPPANLNLTDDYPIEYNGYMANISYQPKNTVLAEAKKYTNQEIAKLGLPQPPTTDGTYHLECSVSGENPTIRWVLNS